MAEREPVPGEVLAGRYEVLAELGRGGMATVFSGLDRRLQRRVAIKVFRGGFADAVDPQRTTQEMRLLAAVNHPSVVAVLDASNGDGVFGAFLVMELVVGDDLGALLHRARGPLAADFARRIVADVASALAALHEQGVVHRDVKPANILVPRAASSTTDGVAAKLTDFGIAQLVDGARLTAPDSILGTAAYLSPEQVKGAPPRPTSDVYSLGLVLLEALTGRRAFPGPAAEAAMARLQRPPALPEDASPALADLLSRMTALDPAHRPAAAEVTAALRELLVGRVTAPDAALTAPTPIAGLPLFAASGAADATQLHEPHFTPGRGMPISAPVAVQRSDRRRFPAVLAVAAAALAAAVTGVAISAASNVAPAATTAEKRVVTSTAPKRDAAPAQQQVGAADEDAEVVKAAPKPSPTATTRKPTPTPTVTSPAATPTTGATTPAEPSGSPTASAPTSSPPADTAPTPSDSPTTDDGSSTAPSQPDGSAVLPVLPDAADSST
ncbi:protein kinase domain-containing protein [Amnibacterium kyonggiense]